MNEKIIISGFGGQGIMFLGKLICQAGMDSGLYVTFLPSYGAEVRGGTAYCHVVLSDKKIASPVVGEADTLIVMNEPSLIRFEESLKPGGVLILNSSLIQEDPERKDVEVVSVPATNIANDIGDVKITNMVLLGIYCELRKNIKKDDIVKHIPDRFVEKNLKAIEAGMNYAGSKIVKS